MSYIRTNSGKIFNYLNIDESQIDIEDIATALSHIPRWLGHTNKFYSVAQHCCWCYDNTKGDKLEALMHDGTETYISDIPTPLKALLPDYKEMENKVALAISNKFGFNYPYSEETHNVDKLALKLERIFIKNLDDNYEPLRVPITDKGLNYWTSEKAKKEFLKRFNHEIVKKAINEKNMAY